MPAKKAVPNKKEPKVLTSKDAKMVFLSVASAFTDHYIGSHAKVFTKKAIKSFSEELLNVFHNMEIVTSEDGQVVVTAAHKTDDKSEDS